MNGFRAGRWRCAVLTAGLALATQVTDPVQNTHPAWSPRGDTIAFESDRAGDFDIWRIRVDGTDLRQLTSGSATDVVASWSPDGLAIAFGSTLDGSSDVFIVDADGGAVRQVTTHEAYDGVPRWAPDGRGIAFDTDRTGKREVWLASAVDRAAPARMPKSPLLAAPDSVHVIAWAPDGRRATATVRHDDDAGDLVLFDLVTGAREVLAARAGWEGAASWSPSGHALALQHQRSDGWVLEVLDVTARTVRTLEVTPTSAIPRFVLAGRPDRPTPFELQ